VDIIKILRLYLRGKVSTTHRQNGLCEPHSPSRRSGDEKVELRFVGHFSSKLVTLVELGRIETPEDGRLWPKYVVLVLNGECYNIVASLTGLIHRRLIKDVQQDAEIQNYKLCLCLLLLFFSAIGRSPGGNRAYTDTDKERQYIKEKIQNKIHK
jgi:hypothetical protein